MDTLKTSDTVQQPQDTLSEYASVHFHRSSGLEGAPRGSSPNNTKKIPKEREIYFRGSGRLQRSAEPTLTITMTSSDDHRIVHENKDLNPDVRKSRKPDSPLYTVNKSSSERDNGYQDRDHNRHGRGGRDNYSSSYQHRNQFTNNNRNKLRRDLDNEKKQSPAAHDAQADENSNPILNKAPPPVINNRSAILSQSTKSYERNVLNGPAASEEDKGRTSLQTENGRNHFKNNRSNQFDNRRNNDNYDRGRGGRHHNRQHRDDRQYYDDHEGRHTSNADLTASTETLSHTSGRKYRGSHSDSVRSQRGRWDSDGNNRGRNNRYHRDSDRQYDNRDRRNSQSQKYNRSRHNTEQSFVDDVHAEEPSSSQDKVPHNVDSTQDNTLSEQMSSLDLNQQIPEHTECIADKDTSDLVLLDASQLNSEYWFNPEDWSKTVEDDVWATSMTSLPEPQELPRDPSPPPIDTSIPPPSLPPQDDRDWASIRSKPQDDTSSNHSWKSQRQNHDSNWSRGRDSRNYKHDYNDRYGEPKKKQYGNHNSGSPGGRFNGGRGGQGQFQGSYWELPPRLRKQREEQLQQQQRSNQQRTSADSHWTGESLEIRGNRHQDNRHYNSLPPPGKQRYDEGPPRSDFNRDRRSSTYDPDMIPRPNRDQAPPPANPPPLMNISQTSGEGENAKLNWAEDVEREEKVQALKSQLQGHSQSDFQGHGPPGYQGYEAPARGRAGRSGFHGGRGGFNGGRARDDRREYQHENADSRPSSRSSRRRRKRSHINNVNKSGSSGGSRRRSHSRDTVDTNISSTTSNTTRSRKNSDHSASERNWRERAPTYEHNRSSDVANWRERGNNSSSQDWKSLRSGGRAPPEQHWRQPPPQISEEPTARQGGDSLSTSHGGIIRIPSQEYAPSIPQSRDNPARTPLLFNPHNPSHPIPVHSAHSRPSANQAMTSTSTRFEHVRVNGVPLKPPEGHYGITVPKHWYSKTILTKEDVGKHMYAVVTINNEISTILSERGLGEASLTRLNELRATIKDIFLWFVRYNIRFCQKENVESALWKLAFYNVIEAIKNGPQNADRRDYGYQKVLNEIIEDGIVYFEGVLAALEVKYKFKLEEYLNKDACSMKTALGFALQSALKICIFLGDLCRYSSNYPRAVQWYATANALNPRNGRPYNQLGLIAFTERRQLEAVYYSARSLLTVSPMRCVYERLIMVFDENRKLYETAYASSSHDERIRDSKRKETREYRREIWIHPEDNRSTARNQLIHDSDSDVEAEAMEKLAALSHVDLSKQFTCSFLLVHGKLFSKTGLESLPLISKQMLREFKFLLAQNGLTCKKLLQLLSINMFSIERTQLKDSSLGGDYKSLTQEMALVISLEIFYCLVHQCNALLAERVPITSEHLINILPAIKIWTDWFVCQTKVWNPPPATCDYHVGSRDVWTELALLVNNLMHVPCDYSVLVSSDSDLLKLAGDERITSDLRRIPNDFVEVRLAEDIMFFQYPPLATISNIQDPVYTHISNDIDLVHIALQLRTILNFGTGFLVGIDPPVLTLHKTDNGQDEFISIVEIVNKGESEEESDKNTEWDEKVEEARENEQPVPEAMSSEYQQLLEKRQILNRQEEQSELKKRILECHRKFRVQLEIKPHYLVPDTNCFIDYLSELQSLAGKKTAQADVIKRNLFTILIPCIVYNELCNIAKSAKKSVQVVNNAQLALKYIQSETSIKYVTTRGTFLSKNMFSMEEDDDLLKNDDKILETCLSLARKKSRKPLQSGDHVEGVEIIYRDLVLLTEDRNLRLKALGRDVPVTHVTHFVQWCNTCQSAG